MVIGRKLRSMHALTWRERGRVLEAMAILAAARLALALLPYRIYSRWLTGDGASGAADIELIARVRRGVQIAARNLPFAAPCLPQAMAAKVMLARRGAGSSVCVGAAPADTGDLALHAWLEAGGVVVIGNLARSGMTPVARFEGERIHAWRPRPDR